MRARTPNDIGTRYRMHGCPHGNNPHRIFPSDARVTRSGDAWIAACSRRPVPTAIKERRTMKLQGFGWIVGSLLIAACGSSSSAPGGNGSTPSTGDDAGAPETVDAAPAVDAAPPVDHGAPSSTYPAFTPQMPTVQKNTGVVLQAPKIVLVTWPGETNAATYESFVDNLGQTAYWKAISSEYGISPAVSGDANHIHMTTPFADSITGNDIDTLVTVNATQTASGAIARTRPSGRRPTRTRSTSSSCRSRRSSTPRTVPSASAATTARRRRGTTSTASSISATSATARRSSRRSRSRRATSSARRRWTRTRRRARAT